MRVLNYHTTLLLPPCVLFYFIIHHIFVVMSDTLMSRRPKRKLEMLGDINLGALVSMSQYDSERRACSEELHSPILIHLPLTMEYMISEVNRMKILPRNLTLGIVVLDDCYTVKQTMAQCLSFLPQNRCDAVNRLSTATKSYDVVGVIGSYTIAQTKFLAKTLSIAEIPVVGFKARSGDLSDKEEYPYFIRTTTSERPLYLAFSRILKSLKWKYISVVYERDHTGINQVNAFRDVIGEQFICLATVESGTMESNVAEIDRIVHALHKTSEARVVVLLTTRFLAYKVIQAAGHLPGVAQGYFIWMDLMGWVQEIESMKDLGKLLWGTLLITDYCQIDRPYHDHFKNLIQNNTSTQVPWFQDFMKKYVSCSSSNSTCKTTLQGFMYYGQSGRVLDAVYMFAKAISRILERPRCRAIYTSDRECITGRELRDELLNTSYTGYCEWLHIDSKGDRNTSYLLRQVLPGVKTGTFYDVVEVFHLLEGKPAINVTENITWQYHWLPKGKTTPESSCSVPCTERQAKVIQENKCCWHCHDCRDNEYFINRKSQCEPCPKYTWPDPDTDYETCREIPPSVPVLWSTRSLFHITVAALFTIGCTSILIFFIRHKNSRIIKASSTLLSFIMLFAIFLGNVTIIMLRLHPNDVICRITFVFFCTSFSLLYGALLTRAFVIYRIFTQSLLSARKPSLTSRADQIKICVGIVFIQLLLCAGVLISYDTWVKKTMADVTVEFVELSCSFPLIGLLLFLAYNVIMLALCSYLAYKTRNLPTNFNETFYIAMSVMTTLLIWFALTPSYTITTKHSTQMDIVSLAVTVNHFVAIVFLFLPKIYVIVWAGDYFKTRFHRIYFASESGFTSSSFGSQDFMNRDKRKRRVGVVPTREATFSSPDLLYTQSSNVSSVEVMKIHKDMSNSEVDSPDASSTSKKNDYLQESKEHEQLKTSSIPPDLSMVTESTTPNDPGISNVPELETQSNEMNIRDEKLLRLFAPFNDLLRSYSDPNMNIENELNILVGARDDLLRRHSDPNVNIENELDILLGARDDLLRRHSDPNVNIENEIDILVGARDDLLRPHSDPNVNIENELDILVGARDDLLRRHSDPNVNIENEIDLLVGARDDLLRPHSDPNVNIENEIDILVGARDDLLRPHSDPNVNIENEIDILVGARDDLLRPHSDPNVNIENEIDILVGARDDLLRPHSDPNVNIENEIDILVGARDDLLRPHSDPNVNIENEIDNLVGARDDLLRPHSDPNVNIENEIDLLVGARDDLLRPHSDPNVNIENEID